MVLGVVHARGIGLGRDKRSIETQSSIVLESL